MQSLTIDIPGLQIAALRFNQGASHRVLAVHGWLDNAASFIPLAGELADVDLVAIDLPGHGHSAHLDPGSHYHFIDIMHWVLEVASALQWQRFHYLGHSLGGCIAPYIAVASPESVSSLMMVEACGPITEPPQSLPDRLKRSISDQRSLPGYKSRVLASVQQAVDARLQATAMTRGAAQLIVERQLNTIEGGYSWRYDQRHRATSPLYQTEEQTLAVLAAVSCPALAILADEGYLVERPQTPQRLAQLADLTQYTVPGHHHMHMDDPTTSGKHIRHFLAHWNATDRIQAAP